MISAKDALQLPSAQLSADEQAAVDKLESQIEECVKTSMGRGGCEIRTTVTDKNIVAEVNLRLRRAGYRTNWSPLIEKHRLNQAIQEHVGFHLALAPNDEAYEPDSLH